jgi:predicted ATPase
MFALATLDEKQHRRFLVLDEQDCWLRPDLVPRLVKIIHEAGRALGFQVLLISHHDVSLFEQYAERVYQFVPQSNGSVAVKLFQSAPGVPDLQERMEARDGTLFDMS